MIRCAVKLMQICEFKLMMQCEIKLMQIWLPQYRKNSTLFRFQR